MNLFTINVQFTGFVIALIGLVVFLAWVIYALRHVYLLLVTEPECVNDLRHGNREFSHCWQ